MKTKAIVTGAVVLVVLVFLAILLIVSRKPPQALTVRHVKSVQSADTTTMTFEIKNHTASKYIYGPYEVQLRNGNAWTKFQSLDGAKFGPFIVVGPTGLVHYAVNVTNLPAKSVVRLSIWTAKNLLGLSGLFRRVEINLEYRIAGKSMPLSLNPYDRQNVVYGKTTQVKSDAFVETVK